MQLSLSIILTMAVCIVIIVSCFAVLGSSYPLDTKRNLEDPSTYVTWNADWEFDTYSSTPYWDDGQWGMSEVYSSTPSWFQFEKRSIDEKAPRQIHKNVKRRVKKLKREMKKTY